MSGLLSALGGFFLEGREQSEPLVGTQRGPLPDTAAVVGAGRAARVAGAALALRLASEAGARCAVVCGWADGRAGGALAVPQALRAAAALRERGIGAKAAGRLVRVALGDDADPAAALFQAGAVVRGPAVLVVDRPRTDAVDAVLARVDLLVLVEPEDGALADAAALSLAALGPATARCPAPHGLATSLLAGAGIGASRAARLAVGAALEVRA